MLKTLLFSRFPQRYYAAMHGMQIASQSAINIYPACISRYSLFNQRFSTTQPRAAKRSVVVEAAKQDPEELVKRLSRGLSLRLAAFI